MGQADRVDRGGISPSDGRGCAGDNGNDEADSAVHFATWISALRDDHPRACSFMAWNGPVGPTGPKNSNGSSLLTDPGVIDQGQLRSQGLSGTGG